MVVAIVLGVWVEWTVPFLVLFRIFQPARGELVQYLHPVLWLHGATIGRNVDDDRIHWCGWLSLVQHEALLIHESGMKRGCLYYRALALYQ